MDQSDSKSIELKIMSKTFSLVIFTCFLFIFFFLSFISTKVMASEPDNVAVFINQVRGNECCQVGKIEFLQKQIDEFNRQNFPATFVLRYDVLTNPNFLQIIKLLNPQNFEIGGFLEITPGLTQDAGVEYLANETNWSQAQNAYTIGYQFEDRQKIIDSYIKAFQNFLSTPSFT